MKRLILTIVIISLAISVQAQVGLGTDNPKASLDIRSTNQVTPSNEDGILIPKIDDFPATNPTADQDGMIVFVTGLGTAARGFYYWDTSSWSLINAGASAGDIDEVIAGNGLVGGATTGSATINAVAENGLTTAADNIVLGGTLNQNTTISYGNFSTDFDLNGTGDFNVQDNGTTQFSVQDNGDVRADNTTFYVDASTDRVGIGTTAPGDKLHVVGDILLTGGVRNIEGQAGDQNIQLDDANPTWNGEVYGGVTRFFGDGTLANSKLEAGGIQLERRIQIRGGNPALGRVLTSDAAGNATWQDPSSGDIDEVIAGNGLVGGATTGSATINAVAENGLTTAADNIVLGGALTQNTILTFGNFSTDLNLKGTGDFNIQDDGVNHFSVSDNGDSAFGGDVEWRDGNSAGTLLANLLDDGNDGRFRIYENEVVSVDLDANTQFVFNEQGLDRNFRVESDGNANMLFIDADLDRVGIGTGAPVDKLEVADGRVEFTATTDANATPGSGVLEIANRLRLDGNEIITNLNTTLFLQNDNNGDLNVDGNTLYVDASEDNVGVGTANLDRNFHIAHDQYTAGGGFGGLEIEQLSNGSQWTLYTSQSTSQLSLYFNNGMRGNFNSVSGNYTATSDRRLKKNIESFQPTLDDLMKMSPKMYHYKTQSNEESKIAGFIAQEVKEIFPSVVKVQEDDTNGNSEIKDLHLISYSELIPFVIKATQEQQEVIEAQQKQIDELKSLVKQLIDKK